MKQKIDHAIVDALVIRDGKFLLIQEGRPERNGTFNLPGGHVDGHETLFEAAVRETKEESGYDIELTGLVGVYQSIYDHINVSGPVFCAKITGGEATPSAEHPKIIWVDEHEIMEMAKKGKLFTKYPPFAVNHYLKRGPFSLDIIASDDYTTR